MFTRRNLIIALVAVFVFWIAGNPALHLGQIQHDRLPWDISAQYPPDKPVVPGEIFASTLAEIVDHELHTGFGWRPNDLYLWGPKVMADNNSDRQLGIIMAVHETMRVFKDHLTKVSSNQYDQNLVVAETDFRNDAEKWLLPSAERKYEDKRDAPARVRRRAAYQSADITRAEPARGRTHTIDASVDGPVGRCACELVSHDDG